MVQLLCNNGATKLWKFTIYCYLVSGSAKPLRAIDFNILLALTLIWIGLLFPVS